MTHGQFTVRFRLDVGSQFADICEVNKGGLFGPHSHHLGGLHHKLPLLSRHHVGVLFPHDVENSVQELRDN